MSSAMAPVGSPSSSGRMSPIVPLAPLEYLQNQRRGSITDPSLHAASHVFRLPADQSTSTVPVDQPPTYAFPESSLNAADSSPQFRKFLRSPPQDNDHSRLASPSTSKQNDLPPRDIPPIAENILLQGTSNIPDVEMRTDRDLEKTSLPQRLPGVLRYKSPTHFDYNMRRHSIAVDPHSQPPSLLSVTQGTKRKTSSDRVPTGHGEEADSQLAGPGIPSSLDLDVDGPAPKRRGSAIDTKRIAQLSLNDRRGSVDARTPNNFWMNERRDSTSSMFSNLSSSVGYTSAFSGSDSPHSQPPPGIATFAWPSNTHPPAPSSIQQEVDPTTVPRAIDPSSSVPPILPTPPFAADRRMSAPETSVLGTAQNRSLRSRARPSSRQGKNVDHSTPSSGQEDSVSAPSPTNSTTRQKEPGISPYSRSPELRVSHKLAERKRRKEMKELFDELRDQLPADRGMKASKWEILSKAIDYVNSLKQAHQDMSREIDMLRHENELMRQASLSSYPSTGAPPQQQVLYPGAPPMQGPYSLQAPPQAISHSQVPLSRPGSSQNIFPPSVTGTPHTGGIAVRTNGPT